MTLLKNYRFYIATFYLICISVLFCLPGSTLPKNDWLAKIWFDKWVHIGFFLILVWLWSWVFKLNDKRSLFILLLLATIYGLGVEIMQDQFVSNREADAGDWLADVIGSLIGLFLWRYTHIKK